MEQFKDYIKIIYRNAKTRDWNIIGFHEEANNIIKVYLDMPVTKENKIALINKLQTVYEKYKEKLTVGERSTWQATKEVMDKYNKTVEVLQDLNTNDQTENTEDELVLELKEIIKKYGKKHRNDIQSVLNTLHNNLDKISMKEENDGLPF